MSIRQQVQSDWIRFYTAIRDEMLLFPVFQKLDNHQHKRDLDHKLWEKRDKIRNVVTMIQNMDSLLENQEYRKKTREFRIPGSMAYMYEKAMHIENLLSYKKEEFDENVYIYGWSFTGIYQECCDMILNLSKVEE